MPMSIPHVKLYRCLYPLTWIYSGVTALRNKLFDCNILQSKSFSVPTICIGNLSVGGTGKTPHTEYLVDLLKDDYAVAVLSRGYKRKTKGYILSDRQSDAQTIGDEPYQIKSKYPGIRVAVCEKRCDGMEQLLQLDKPQVEAVILDDAFQHRYVKAGLYILLTDYNRLFSEDAVLPVGRLREAKSGKERAQIVIVTKCPDAMQEEDFKNIEKRLNLLPYQELYFSKFDYASLQPLFSLESDMGKEKTIPHEALQNKEVLLVTGIAAPQPLIKKIKEYAKRVEIAIFDDHHDFAAKDIELIEEKFALLNKEDAIIITTEKDGTRFLNHPHLSDEIKKHIYVQPITITILRNQQNSLNQHIRDYVRENQRNCGLS